MVRSASSLAEYALRTYDWGFLSTIVGMEMILIPAGDFLMGDEDQSDNPRRTVFLNSYLIARHPVTVQQYMTFVKATRHRVPLTPLWGWKDHHPIVNVSWEDALHYCLWATMQSGRAVMLPTEAQWEKAARGPNGRRYPWGSDWDNSRLHCSKKSYGDANSTADTRAFSNGASSYGVLDMAGNVWEWCSDWYDNTYMKMAPSYDPGGPDTGTVRVLRGGSWYIIGEEFFRCAYRHWFTPLDRYKGTGFRVVVPVETDLH